MLLTITTTHRPATDLAFGSAHVFYPVAPAERCTAALLLDIDPLKLVRGPGAATLVPLAKAPEQALADRMLARSGGDPLSAKRRIQGVPTFAEAAHCVLEQKRSGRRSRWHAQNWWRSMERVRLPQDRQPAVSEVNTTDVRRS